MQLSEESFCNPSPCIPRSSSALMPCGARPSQYGNRSRCANFRLRNSSSLGLSPGEAMVFAEELFPSWMIPLYRCCEYFQSCEECWRSDGGGLLVKGKIPAKYQKNFFVLCNGALALACSHCKDVFVGKGTIRIQIRRSSHHGKRRS